MTLADRLEAALKRERGISRGGAEAQSGNATKIRKALAEIRDAAHVWISIGGISARRTIEMAFEVATAALAEPPRNCDVGTVEEQCARYIRFCRQHAPCDNGNCQLRMAYDCKFTWGNMPYKEGGEQCQEAIK